MSTVHLHQQYERYLTINNWVQTSYKHEIIAQKNVADFQCQLHANHFESGIFLSRLQGRGHGVSHNYVEQMQHNLSLVVVLSGNHRFLSGKKELYVGSEQIWLAQGNFEDINGYTEGNKGELSVIGLDYSLDRIEQWQELGLLGGKNGEISPHGNSQVRKVSDTILPIKYLARRLLENPSQANGLSSLDLEISTLTLTEKLLKFYLADKISSKQRIQIDEVIDIIYAEFDQPLTISFLARRVGMNECYLKQYFKAQTGETIAEFIRRLRLEKALDMLVNEKKSIKETMFFVGYSSIEHFNKIFTQQFGLSPKQAKSLS